MTNAIIIMDGFGIRKETRGNAITGQGTPNFNAFKAAYPYAEIEASGRAVGLPKNQMGNSEVGHLNLGAGRVVYQDITQIDKSIEDGDFFTNPSFIGAINNVKKTGGALHLVGLTSNGGVHSHINHLYALIELAKRNNVEDVYIHCITDGRDVPPDSGRSFVAELTAKMSEIGIGKIATVIGRYYYMDRDNRWERVQRGYNGVMAGVGTRFTNADAGIAASYAVGVNDEFIEPIIVGGYKGVNEGDSIIFYNFRSDRAREITRAIISPDFKEFARVGGFKKVFYVGMTQYDINFTGIETAFAPKQIINTLGEYLAKNNKTQARIAETEKYAHVTFFFNGGVEKENKGEKRVLVPSPKVATYDMQPQMSAYEVTEKTLNTIDEGVDVIILNFANCDMVGHTGVLSAAIKAVEAVDICVKKVVDKILASGGNVILTADHGNAELMSFDDGAPCTSHTTNLVPLLVIGEKYKNYKLKSGALCDVAPTLLEIMNIEKPKEMEGQSLLIK